MLFIQVLLYLCLQCTGKASIVKKLSFPISPSRCLFLSATLKRLSPLLKATDVLTLSSFSLKAPFAPPSFLLTMQPVCSESTLSPRWNNLFPLTSLQWGPKYGLHLPGLLVSHTFKEKIPRCNACESLGMRVCVNDKGN